MAADHYSAEKTAWHLISRPAMVFPEGSTLAAISPAAVDLPLRGLPQLFHLRPLA
jgi:hypothetical protein